jgi:Tfp pilus assembly protein PilV
MMSSIRHRLNCRRRATDDRGISLIEITIAMLILSLIVPVVYGLLDSVEKSQVSVASRDVASGQAQVIGEVLSRQIHAAAIPTGGSTTTIVSATANTFQFFAALGNANGPTELTIKTALTCGSCTTYNMVETLVQPGPGDSYTTGATTTTATLGTGVVPPSTTTVGTDCSTTSPGIFQYYNSSGTCLPLGTGTTPPALTSSQYPTVDNVTVTLTTLDVLRPKTSATVTYTLQLTLPNVDYYNEFHS